MFHLQLPPSIERSRLLQQYFDNFHPEYPFLDQRDIETRLSRTLARLGCPTTDTGSSVVVAIDSEASSFMALICAIFALSQSTSRPLEEARSGHQPADHVPGYATWSTSRKLQQAFDGVRSLSLETISCHVLNSVFALHADMVDVALQLHAAAARLLPAVDSPNSCWRRGQQGRSRNAIDLLWWTVFILDRTLSRISETPYVLHPDKLPDGLRRGLEAPMWQGQTCERLPPNAVSSLELWGSENDNGALHMDAICLQVVAYICNLWSSFSDQVLSMPIRGHHCTLRLSALLDTELQVCSASIPAILQWGTPETPEDNIRQGSPSYLNRRLSILLVSASVCATGNEVPRLTDEGNTEYKYFSAAPKGGIPRSVQLF